MFTMLLESMTKLIPRLLLLLIYILSVSFLVSFFNDDVTISIKYCIYHPIETILYLYRYIKWWVANKDYIGMQETLTLFASFVLPWVVFVTLLSVLRVIRKYLKIWCKNLFSKLFSKRDKIIVHNNELSQQKLANLKSKMMQNAERRINQHLQELYKKQDQDKRR